MQISAGTRRTDILSIPMPATEQSVATVVHVIPVRRAANDIFSMASSILIATPVDRSASPSANLLQGLFDLTPAEAKVAQAVALAKTVEEIAIQQNVGIETVRSQLKKVFNKTGTTRQVSLARLLAGLTLPGNDPKGP
jgi:DNA-binding CsgD family transcriptional regulator